MGTITPILDTLLPQVLGRAGDVARLGSRSANGPLSALRPVSGDMPSTARQQTPYPGRAAIEPATGAAVRSRSSRGAGAPVRDPVLAATQSRDAQGLSTQLHLSRGGDALVRLLGALGQTKTPAPTSTGPLVDNTSVPRASALAAVLGEQVSASGLFYESHLAKWVRGLYPLTRLAAEPQAQFAAPTTARGEPGGDSARAAAAGEHTGSSSVVDPRLATVVRQQAELLATGVFHWQGDAWPGAPMRWQIHEPAQSQRDDSGDESVHSTSLSLTLGGLGDFEARLSVTDDGRVRVAAWAEDGIGRSLVAADLDTLRERLRQAGFTEPSVRLLTESDA